MPETYRSMTDEELWRDVHNDVNATARELEIVRRLTEMADAVPEAALHAAEIIVNHINEAIDNFVHSDTEDSLSTLLTDLSAALRLGMDDVREELEA